MAIIYPAAAVLASTDLTSLWQDRNYLDGDGFAQSKSLQVAASLDRIRFTLEKRGTSTHKTHDSGWTGLPQGNFTLIVNNENKAGTPFSGGSAGGSCDSSDPPV